MRTKKKM